MFKHTLFLFALLLGGSLHAAPIGTVDFASLGSSRFWSQICEPGCGPLTTNSGFENITLSPGIELQNWFDGRFSVDFQENGMLEIILLRDIHLKNNGPGELYDLAFFFDHLPRGAFSYGVTVVAPPRPLLDGLGSRDFLRIDLSGSPHLAGESIRVQLVYFAVPEPSTLACVVAGFVVLDAVRRWHLKRPRPL